MRTGSPVGSQYVHELAEEPGFTRVPTPHPNQQPQFAVHEGFRTDGSSSSQKSSPWCHIVTSVTMDSVVLLAALCDPLHPPTACDCRAPMPRPPLTDHRSHRLAVGALGCAGSWWVSAWSPLRRRCSNPDKPDSHPSVRSSSPPPSPPSAFPLPPPVPLMRAHGCCLLAGRERRHWATTGLSATSTGGFRRHMTIENCWDGSSPPHDEDDEVGGPLPRRWKDTHTKRERERERA